MEGVVFDEVVVVELLSPFFPLKLPITPSKCRKRERSSVSGGRLDFLGARPGGGNTHSMPDLAQLEQGDVPLEEALDKFQEGISLSRDLKKTLQDAEETLAKIVTADGSEEIFENNQ